METEKPITRVQLFARLKKLSIKKFEETCQLSPHVIQNAINRKSNMSDDTLGKILLTFPDLSLKWVLLGKGEMLLDKNVSANAEMQQEPDYKEFLGLIQRIGDAKLVIPMQNKLFELYQSNSDLKTELINAYKLIRNV